MPNSNPQELSGSGGRQDGRPSLYKIQKSEYKKLNKHDMRR